MHKKVLIIGGGLTGLASAFFLEQAGVTDYCILEQEDTLGGLCRTCRHQGYEFDYAGHYLHFRHQWVYALVQNLLGDNLLAHQRNSKVYAHGVLVDYPFQAHLYGLPVEVVAECLCGYLHAHCRRASRRGLVPQSFGEWIADNLGEGIGRQFMYPYNRKAWSMDPGELSTEWMQGYVPEVSLEEVVRGALQRLHKSFGYHATFFYPRQGGIQALVEALSSRIPAQKIYRRAQVVTVLPQQKQVRLADGRSLKYDVLINTAALKYFVALLNPAPEAVTTAAGLLRHNRVSTINLVIQERLHRDASWVYFPDERLCFYRIGLPFSLCQPSAARDQSLLSIEVASAATQDSGCLSEEEVVRDLSAIGFLKDPAAIVARSTLSIPVAYVSYDQNWQPSRRTILEWCGSNDIYSIGRYGNWFYATMEDSFLQAQETVAEIAGVTPAYKAG